MKGNVARCKLCLGKLKAINEVRCNQMRLHDDSRRGPRTRRWHCTLEILVRWTDCWGGGSASGEARLGEPGQSPHARSWLVSVNERLTSTVTERLTSTVTEWVTYRSFREQNLRTGAGDVESP